jgi:hypothetical protein
MIDFFYALGTWGALVVVISVSTAVALGGLWVTARLVPLDARREHNDVLGFAAATAGVVYAVLTGFVAVGVWVSYGAAGDIVSREANQIGDLFRDARELPEPQRGEISAKLRNYIQTVIDQEWPAMAAGLRPESQGWILLQGVYTDLVRMRTAQPLVQPLVGEALIQLNASFDSRRARLFVAAGHGMDHIMWIVLVLGSLATLGFCWLFGFSHRGLHQASTALVGCVIGLIFLVILTYDHPFRGASRITPDEFQRIRANMDRVLSESATDVR